MNDPLNPTEDLGPIGKPLPSSDPLRDSLLPGTGLSHGPTDPLNPVGPPSLVPDPLPPGDPMLDALEQSIENPPGFVDPLTEQDGPLIDDVAMRLGDVEASIENTPATFSAADGQNDFVSTSEDDDSDVTDTVLPLDLLGLTEAEVDASQDVQAQARQSRPNHASSNRKPPFVLRSGDGARGRHGLSFPGAKPSRGHKTGARFTMSTRFCPDISELIAKENCEYCDKYRHWPEGTDDEPKECWHDWEAAPKVDKHGDEDDEEDE